MITLPFTSEVSVYFDGKAERAVSLLIGNTTCAPLDATQALALSEWFARNHEDIKRLAAQSQVALQEAI